jgi:multidrug resistance efflux pump
MTPTNNKSLLHFIFDQMEKLDKKEIDIDQAKAQALLAKQANNSLKYELDRANVQMKLAEHNLDRARIDLRNAEGSNF